MEKQPVTPEEFVRLETIVKTVEMLSALINKPGQNKSLVIGSWLETLGLIVRDHFPDIFNRYPVVLDKVGLPGRLLRHAVECVQDSEPLFGAEEILKESFWELILGQFDRKLIDEQKAVDDKVFYVPDDLLELTPGYGRFYAALTGRQ